MNTPKLRVRQIGAALVTGLILLLIISVLGFAAIRSNTAELRIANNLEAQNVAFQQAQAGLDYLVGHPELMPVLGTTGYTFCSSNLSHASTLCNGRWISCDETNLTLPSPMGSASALQVTRGGMGGGVPPRVFATSSKLFKTAYYEARSCYDASGAGDGKTDLMTGLMRIIRAD
ncbi:pilus assembly PilX family protein [Methylotetracoccus oryzae]|uniref:pilus assembly PilX family protein n=1 Tax=Methylotetracoccus oryzae TaxID=1919059 RepID=UPI00111A43C0|nr:PilX N-terminal domain-containing pilus assembly protein [Methylotetracoccus oryzae]